MILRVFFTNNDEIDIECSSYIVTDGVLRTYFIDPLIVELNRKRSKDALIKFEKDQENYKRMYPSFLMPRYYPPLYEQEIKQHKTVYSLHTISKLQEIT